MRGQDPVVEDGIAQARAQGHDHLQAVARDDAGPGDLGVVEDQGGDAQGLGDGGTHVEAAQASTRSGSTLERGPSLVM